MSTILNTLPTIDEADPVDVASFDSFPASDAPAWVASGIGAHHTHAGDINRPAPAGNIPNEVHHAAVT